MIAVLSPIDLAAVIVVAAVVLAALFRRGKRLELKIGNVQASVTEAAKAASTAAEKASVAAEKVEAVNAAVNNRPAGDPTLYENVRAVMLQQAEIAALGHRTAAKVEELGADFKRHVAEHQADRNSSV